jgi:hypothetical protein
MLKKHLRPSASEMLGRLQVAARHVLLRVSSVYPVTQLLEEPRSPLLWGQRWLLTLGRPAGRCYWRLLQHQLDDGRDQ